MLNPLRYRGYVYDTDTGLYYLQSRYYDSVTGRILNADDSDILQMTQNKILEFNLFSYCGNNPICNIDPDGFRYYWYDFYRSKWFVSGLITLGIALAVGGAVSAITKTLSRMIARIGRRAVVNYLSYSLKSALVKQGLKLAFAKKIVGVIGAIFTVFSAFMDIGGYIFNYLDARDKRKNSGYLDF